MRIIAGDFRGRIIRAPEGIGTRPMLDRVREAVFSTLGERVVDARVLDLFAGSGALGLESLSRGAASVRFVERSAPALAALKRNVEELGLRELCRVIRGDALRPSAWREEGVEREPFTLGFMDPPYPLFDDPNSRAQVLAAIRALFEATLAPTAVLVLHTATRAGETLRLGSGLATETRTYGSSSITYIERAPDGPST